MCFRPRWHYKPSRVKLCLCRCSLWSDTRRLYFKSAVISSVGKASLWKTKIYVICHFQLNSRLSEYEPQKEGNIPLKPTCHVLISGMDIEVFFFFFFNSNKYAKILLTILFNRNTSHIISVQKIILWQVWHKCGIFRLYYTTVISLWVSKKTGEAMV